MCPGSISSCLGFCLAATCCSLCHQQIQEERASTASVPETSQAGLFPVPQLLGTGMGRALALPPVSHRELFFVLNVFDGRVGERERQILASTPV